MEKMCTECNWFSQNKSSDPEIAGFCDLYSGNVTFQQAIAGCANWEKCNQCKEHLIIKSPEMPKRAPELMLNKVILSKNQKRILIRTAREQDSEKAWKVFSLQPPDFYRYIHGITRSMVESWYPKDKIDFNKSYPINVFTLDERDREDEFIGNAILLFHSPLSHRSHVVKFGFGIIPSFQGQGIGKELLNISLNQLNNFPHIKKVQTEVVCDNHSAINLYLKAGFKVEGTRPKSWAVESKFYDTYIMGLLL